MSTPKSGDRLIKIKFRHLTDCNRVGWQPGSPGHGSDGRIVRIIYIFSLALTNSYYIVKPLIYIVKYLKLNSNNGELQVVTFQKRSFVT